MHPTKQPPELYYHQDSVLWNRVAPVWFLGTLDEMDFYFHLILVTLNPKQLHEAGNWTAQGCTGSHLP